MVKGGVSYVTSHHSNSVKKEKYCHVLWKAWTIFGWLEEGVLIGNTQGVLGKIEGKKGGGVLLLHYRPTRDLGGDDRCHATNLHEADDSRDVCHVIPFMWARPVTWQ